MVFSSITFLFAFLPATLLGYYVLPRRWRLAFLLLVSLVFYAWGEPVYVLLMMGSSFFNYLFLKANGVEEGTRSYSATAESLIALYEKLSGE